MRPWRWAHWLSCGITLGTPPAGYAESPTDGNEVVPLAYNSEQGDMTWTDNSEVQAAP
jgi:hypothetical protein